MTKKANKKNLKLSKDAGKSRYTRRQESSRDDSRSLLKPDRYSARNSE